MDLLNFIQVTSKQLHPNSRVFIEGFEILCDFFSVEASVKRFFYFFKTKGGMAKKCGGSK
jgi:hypothetical protein